MLWDDNYVYVGGVLEEDEMKGKVSEGDRIMYYENEFEVLVDRDGEGEN